MTRTFALVAMAWLSIACGLAQGGVALPKPPKTGFVLDEANLLSSDTKSQVNQVSASCKNSTGAPIVVVTIKSLASKGAPGWSIEAYALHLFNTWGIGSKSINKGVLLLISRNDRKARIELGADWARSRDYECQNIMNSDVVPHFKNRDFNGGVLAGVQSLDQMVRRAGGAQATPPDSYSGSSGSNYSGSSYPNSDYPGANYPNGDPSFPSDPLNIIGMGGIGACFCPLMIFGIIASVARSLGGGGRFRGGGYYGGGYHHHNSFGGWSDSGSSSGGWSGGSSGGSSSSGGGGYSGGGGASGSW